jgi:hypothetical protein
MAEYNEEDIKAAKFNAGQLQTIRINEILDLLNFCHRNAIAWNTEYLTWNYNLIYECINNLYGEVEGFLTDSESKMCMEVKEKVKKFMQDFPIKPNKRNPELSNNANLDAILKVLGYYERVIKRYGVKYKLITTFGKAAGRM